MEKIKCEQVGQIDTQGVNEMTGRVYGVNGLSQSIRTFCGGNQEVKILCEPFIVEDFYKNRGNRHYENEAQTIRADREGLKVVEPLAYDEQNRYLRKDGICGTLTTAVSSPKHNNRVVEPLVYDGFNQQVRTDSTTSGTITRNVGADLKRNGQGIIEPLTEYELSHKMKKYINSKDDKYQVSEGKLQVNRAIATPITTREGSASADASNYLCADFEEDQNIANVDMAPFRVRKLTEKECFRLQGVKDEDFEKIRRNQSKSSCYHLAGDSITTSVLMGLFGQMLCIDWRSKVNDLVDDLQG